MFYVLIQIKFIVFAIIYLKTVRNLISTINEKIIKKDLQRKENAPMNSENSQVDGNVFSSFYYIII